MRKIYLRKILNILNHKHKMKYMEIHTIERLNFIKVSWASYMVKQIGINIQ